MSTMTIEYRGFVLYPLAALEDGVYASTLIIEDLDYMQRATGVLAYFSDPDSACRHAIDFGMIEVDERLHLSGLKTSEPEDLSASNLIGSVVADPWPAAQ
jgi:hypothetical protein